MFRIIFTLTFIVLVNANLAQATVCHDYPNPCQDVKLCEAKSDFVFEAVVNNIQDIQVLGQTFGSKGAKIIPEKTATLKIEKWLKGERAYEPTQINFPIDKWYCSEIKPIFPELIVGNRYRIYGVHYRSENYCSSYYGTDQPEELLSCKNSVRVEVRYLWLIESLK